MLACVARAKPEEEDGARAEMPSTKDAVKSLSSQLKDMMLRFSGVYRQCKGGRRRPQQPDDDAGTCLRAERSTSTPAWDFSGSTSDHEARGKATWVPAEEIGEHMEWIAQVETGVQITFVSLPGGAGNDIKRIRFSREVFNKWQAQRWWEENYDRIMELYNVHKFSSQALPIPPRSDDGGEARESIDGSETPALEIRTDPRLARIDLRTPPWRGGLCLPSVPDPTEHIMQHHLRPCGSSSGAAASSSNGSEEKEIAEWVENDESGVYITIREMRDGGRELRHVRFSRGRDSPSCGWKRTWNGYRRNTYKTAAVLCLLNRLHYKLCCFVLVINIRQSCN